MAPAMLHDPVETVWDLALRQHGTVSRPQLWELPAPGARLDVSVPISTVRRRPGIVVHRRRGLDAGVTHRHGIPVTDVVWTLTDLAGSASGSQIEAAIRAADARGLSDPDALRAALGGVQGRPGAGRLRRLLDRRTFRLTDSELERRFLRLADRAGPHAVAAGARPPPGPGACRRRTHAAALHARAGALRAAGGRGGALTRGPAARPAARMKDRRVQGPLDPSQPA